MIEIGTNINILFYYLCIFKFYNNVFTNLYYIIIFITIFSLNNLYLAFLKNTIKMLKSVKYDIVDWDIFNLNQLFSIMIIITSHWSYIYIYFWRSTRDWVIDHIEKPISILAPTWWIELNWKFWHIWDLLFQYIIGIFSCFHCNINLFCWYPHIFFYLFMIYLNF